MEHLDQCLSCKLPVPTVCVSVLHPAKPGAFQVRRKRAVKGMTVNAHFLQLYQNAAGMLPNKSFVGSYVRRLATRVSLFF